MICRRYTDQDFEWVKRLGAGWGAKYRHDQFPKVGFVVQDLAAYFIYQTDSSVCFLENLVSNKFAEPEEREAAVKMVTNACVLWAQMSEFKIAYATTGIKEVIERAESFGAIKVPDQFLLIKKLDPSIDG